MKREGTGQPQHPDIEFEAAVKMSELSFESVPQTEVRFQGNTGRNSVWVSRRENLPDEVREAVIYHDAEVRLWIASEAVSGDEDSQNSLDKGRSRASGNRARTSETSNQIRDPEKGQEVNEYD